MKKAFLIFLCTVFLVGFAEMGHAFLFFGGGGGGGKGGSAGPIVDPSVFQFNFDSLKSDKLDDKDINNYFDGYNRDGEHQEGGGGFLIGGIGDYSLRDETPPVNTTSVPEPATMLLLGLGLIGLAKFGRKML
jgi:hypothetical protein